MYRKCILPTWAHNRGLFFVLWKERSKSQGQSDEHLSDGPAALWSGPAGPVMALWSGLVAEDPVRAKIEGLAWQLHGSGKSPASSAVSERSKKLADNIRREYVLPSSESYDS